MKYVSFSFFSLDLVLLLAVLVFTGLALPTDAIAKDSKKKARLSKQMRKVPTKLGTNFRFDSMSLHGKFQTTPWTSTTVEDDKFLNDLLAARTHFRDRLAKDQERN